MDTEVEQISKRIVDNGSQVLTVRGRSHKSSRRERENELYGEGLESEITELTLFVYIYR